MDVPMFCQFCQKDFRTKTRHYAKHRKMSAEDLTDIHLEEVFVKMLNRSFGKMIKEEKNKKKLN